MIATKRSSATRFIARFSAAAAQSCNTSSSSSSSTRSAVFDLPFHALRHDLVSSRDVCEALRVGMTADASARDRRTMLRTVIGHGGWALPAVPLQHADAAASMRAVALPPTNATAVRVEDDNNATVLIFTDKSLLDLYLDKFDEQRRAKFVTEFSSGQCAAILRYIAVVNTLN